MAIITCIDPRAGQCEGYDPNRYSGDKDAWERHVELAHRATYEGCVLKLGEHNWHDDSDFFALVWDETSQSVTKVEYGITGGWSYHNSATVDASDDVRVKAEAYETARLIRLYTELWQTDKLDEDGELIVLLAQDNAVSNLR